MSIKTLNLTGTITPEETGKLCIELGEELSKKTIGYSICVEECLGYDGTYSQDDPAQDNKGDLLVHAHFFTVDWDEDLGILKKKSLGLFHKIGSFLIIKFFNAQGELLHLQGQIKADQYKETLPYLLLEIVLDNVRYVIDK